MLLFLCLNFFGDIYLNEFMELGVGARALGMGNAFVGLADDPTAFYWNPAGLAQLKNREVFLMHSADIDSSVTTNVGAFIYPSHQYTLGIALYWLEASAIPLTDSTEAGIEDTGWVNTSDYVVYLSCARSVSSIDVGINVKGIYRDWAVASAYGVETDCGILSTFKGIKFGLNLVNMMGAPVYWSDTLEIKDKVPLLVKSGVSIGEKFPIGKINISLGFDTSPEKRVAQFTEIHTDAHFGAEYWWREKLALRIG
ncbi:UPF0164 family protein, partial [candidate division WOR-3 bacterium]|nr:UPF0164 family protein [candidate division WOR-3 bacterium]